MNTLATSILIGISIFATSCSTTPVNREPSRTDKAEVEFVDITSLDASILLDIRYATKNNFTGKVIYPAAKCFLRKPVAMKLVEVQKKLQTQGLSLKVFDCYRPFSVQKRFWEIMPDERYVAKPVEKDGKPANGSKHNRGAAVDLTLVDLQGKELEMPSEYDDFTEKAHRDHKTSKLAKKNMLILEKAMSAQGFIPLPTEWWHFDGPDWQKYGLSDFPIN